MVSQSVGHEPHPEFARIEETFTGPEDPPQWKVEAHYGRACGIGELLRRKALMRQ